VCATVDGLFFLWVLKPALRKMHKKEKVAVLAAVMERERQMSVAKPPPEVR
jgi:hypothetical protein